MFDIIGGGPATRIRPLITWQPDIDGRSYADIVAYLRAPLDRHAGAWFDVYYVHKGLSGHIEYALSSERVTYQAIEQVAVLPAPPVIPLEERLAALPKPTLDGWSEEQIRFIGGPEEALELVASRQHIAVEKDRSLDIFDWEAAARIYTGILETIAPRKLTASQRALVGQARVLEAEEELDSARRSLAKLKTNAGQPQTPGEPAGPGRPSTGDPVKANLPPAHIAQLDALAEARGTTRAALVRAAVASYLLSSE